MGIAEDWADLMFDLECLSKGAAKRKFRKSIKYGWGGLCAYCRCERATTLDHLKAKSRGGSSLRSNLIPACQSCNHSKGSLNWLEWFQRQEFYNSVAQELIEDWISNKRFIEEELDECRSIDRTKVRTNESKIRSHKNEQTSIGENGLAVA
tara:strand:+ start:795 stop:1247 length:453 start_codon:yes stop_codon:yes gene_type:complete